MNAIRQWFTGAALFAALFAAGMLGLLGLSFAQNQAMLLPVDPAPLVATTVLGEKSFSIEVADDASERERGLMFRLDMPDDRGMLFVFETTRPVGFWMKNTPMPLDLVFLAEDGKVVETLPGEPYSQSVISPGQQVPVRFVLELKRGTADTIRLAPGDKLSHPEIAKVGNAG